MLASGAFMRFRASGLNAVLSFGVVFRISISRFDDGPLSRDCLVGELGFMRLSVLQGRCGEAPPRLCGDEVGCPDNSLCCCQVELLTPPHLEMTSPNLPRQ